MQFSYRILVIGSNRNEVNSISRLLEKKEFSVFKAYSESDCIQLAQVELPHLCLISLDIEGGDGIQLCMELREKKVLRNSAIVIFSNKQEVYTQVAALNSGADDYIFYPINDRLFISKIHSLLRRSSQSFAIHNGIKVDKDKYTLTWKKQEFTLPKKEFEIVSLLASKPQKVFSRSEIKQEVWGVEGEVRSRTIDVHIRKLREKIGDGLIRTIKGVGYRLEV